MLANPDRRPYRPVAPDGAGPGPLGTLGAAIGAGAGHATYLTAYVIEYHKAAQKWHVLPAITNKCQAR
jgi:hypothetical protein